MKTVQGDLIKLFKDGKFDIMFHGCNCFHTMGGGIAWAVSHNFPAAFEADLETPKGAIEKLGTISVANVKNQKILNCYTQYRPGKENPQILYDSLQKCMRRIYLTYSGLGLKIGYPKIGAGIAGGDWDTISKIINEELKDLDHTVVIWDK